MADPATALRIERTYQASAEAVFDAWTSEEVLRRWWHAGIVTTGAATLAACPLGAPALSSSAGPGAGTRLRPRVLSSHDGQAVCSDPDPS